MFKASIKGAHVMKKLIPLGAVTAILISLSPVQAENNHLDQSTRNALRAFSIEADISHLTNYQKNEIVIIAHQEGRQGQRNQIMQIVNGTGLLNRIFR